jgi:uncharacterized membrane protein
MVNQKLILQKAKSRPSILCCPAICLLGLEKRGAMAQIMENNRDENQGTQPKRASAAGGVFIALGTIVGTIFGGFAFGQPSIGFVVGLVAGSAAAVLIALTD